MIRVLVVEDTPVVLEFLVNLFNTDPEMHVVGTATDGEEALKAVAQNTPDVITMDVHMPRMNGIDATRRIMETHPTPIVVVSGHSSREQSSLAFRALEAGALAVVERPKGISHPDEAATAADLVQTVKLMSEVRVVRRWARRQAHTNSHAPKMAELRAPSAKLVAIGASTGGPPVLQTILSALPAEFPAPVLIVQHISPGFGEGLAQWLRPTCALPIHVASNGERALGGNVYLARDGFHLGIKSDGLLALNQDAPENGHRPSVSHLFRSVLKAFGEQAVGVLLTGMGKDGAAELKSMKDRGAVTLAQDKASSIVHGMPGEAIQLGGATFVLTPDRVAAVLTSVTNPKKRT